MKQLAFLLCIFIVLILVFPLSGQDIYLGVTGGMNIADMKIIGDGEEQTVEALNLFGIGGFFGSTLHNNFSLQLRTLYIQKGGTINQELPSPDIDIRMSLFELDLSLKATMGNQFRPYIVVGPSIGFLLKAETEFDSDGNAVIGDLMDILNKMEFGLGIGAGIEYSMGKGFLFLEGRYGFGFNNLNNGGNLELRVNGNLADIQEISKDDEYKNKGFQIMTGFVLPLNKK
jgi:hypothetical protein